MGSVFDYEIPILHPIAVHFPIALILLGTAAVVAWALTPRIFWYRVGVLSFLTGAIAALVAYLTGEAAEEAAEDVPIVDEFVDLHEDLAIYTLATTVLTLVALVVAQPGSLAGETLCSSDTPTPLRWAIGALALAAALLVVWTSHVGGIMVWGVPG